jgi:hypothetical protein
MLDDLELPQVQEAALAERRQLAEHRAPGMDGSILQDLGRHPSRFTVWGVAAGPGAAEFVERLADRFRDGGPAVFTADVDAGTRIERVSIAGLRVEELAGRPQRWLYVLSLSEHQAPLEPEPTGAVDAGVLEEAQGMFDGLVAALDLAPFLLTGLEPFIPLLEGMVASLDDVLHPK